jgi:hypothetical protein
MFAARLMEDPMFLSLLDVICEDETLRASRAIYDAADKGSLHEVCLARGEHKVWSRGVRSAFTHAEKKG